MDKRTAQQEFSHLMRRAQDGDAESYRQLLLSITPLVRSTIRRSRPFLQPQDVDDLVQMVLMALHSVRATYEPARPFLPWLMAIMRNQIGEGARRYSRSVGREQPLPETFSETEANIVDDGFGDPGAMRRAIAALPMAQRQAIEMLKLREMTLKEAAVAG
jgi:RNA polymerase sigma-70 factor (ECF subfamily)